VSVAREEKDFRDMEFAYTNRWKQVQEAVTELQAEQLEAETLWGGRILEVLIPFHKCVIRLNIAVNNYLRHRNPAMPDGQRRLLKDTDQILFGLPDTEGVDPFGQELSNAMRGIEEYLRPHVEMHKGLLDRLLSRLRGQKRSKTARGGDAA
jgi:hypothetical protein